MKNRVLGSSGIEVTPLGYGCMGVSHAYGDALPFDEARAVIRDAYDVGYRFFDTAPAYLGETADGRVSNNEALVGEALDDVKGGVVIATKFGVSINPDRSLNISSKPDEIKATVEHSLDYLGVDKIQMLYQHRIDRSTEPEVVAGPSPTSWTPASWRPGASPRWTRGTCAGPTPSAPSPPSRTATR